MEEFIFCRKGFDLVQSCKHVAICLCFLQMQIFIFNIHNKAVYIDKIVVTFARIFTPEPELVAFTAGMLRIYCGALFLMGIQIACQMTLVSTGNAVCSIIVAVLRKFVLLIPLIYILPYFLADKVFAVFLADPVADFIAVSTTATLFYRQYKKL